MGNEQTRDDGLGIVELVVAVFILALVLVAMLPALFHGIAYSSTQAQTAIATRFLYSVVERGREDAGSSTSDWCSRRAGDVASTPGSFTAAVSACSASSDSLVTLTLTATSIGSDPKRLATVTAKVYVHGS